MFFKTPAELRRWFAANHGTARELFVGFYKQATGKASVTYHEALDEALCVGWIDGVRRSLDTDSYVQRFTPRAPKSDWSLVNINRAKALLAAGRMRPAGRRAFEKRDEAGAKRYAFEQRQVALDPTLERQFKKNARAWAFFEAQPPGYRRVMTWWVMSAKRDETRQGRLDKLIAVSARGKRVDYLKPVA